MKNFAWVKEICYSNQGAPFFRPDGIQLGIFDKGAGQGIFKLACLFFSENDAYDEAGRSQEERYYFFEGKELNHKNILPEYLNVAGRSIKREFDFSAYLF